MTANDTQTILQHNLNCKREALDFFFNGQQHLTARNVTDDAINLTIELKSSHTYSSVLNSNLATLQRGHNYSEIIDYKNDYWDSIKRVFMELLRFIGLIEYDDSSIEIGAATKDDEQFIKDHKNLNSLPYTKRNNLLKMKRRLEVDGGGNNKQLDKIKSLMKSPSESKKFNNDEENKFCFNLTNLAKQQHDQLTKMRESSVNDSISHNGALVIDKKPIFIIENVHPKTMIAVGHFNAINLIGPMKYSNHVEDNLDLLIYHPIIERYFTKHKCPFCNYNSNLIKKDQEYLNKKIRSMKLVDCLYGKVFNLNHPYDSFEVKLSKLLNRCDYDFLLNLIYPIKRECYFKLDPYMDSFDNLATDQQQDSNKQLTVRQRLLIWRWVNNLSRLIQLSESEIIKSYSFQINIENFKSNQLKKLHKIQPEKGYKLIEQIRLMAIEYLKKYEIQLNEIIKLNSEKVESNENQITRAKDLLKEPKIKINFQASLNIIRALIPKTTAKRPLMPKRKSKGVPGASIRLSNLINSITMINNQQLALNNRHHLVDLESQVISQWRQFATTHNNSNSRLISDNNNNNTLEDSRTNLDIVPTSITRPSLALQLVVTIQQATNVPMRLNYNYNHHHHQLQVQQQQQFPMNRSTSPFLSPSPTNSFNQQQTNSYLVSPTTYVEVIFQRNQQASSLSQGKNPSWNETLFFPINTNNTKPITIDYLKEEEEQRSINTSESQLIDEYLQLNLYDYNCYLLQNDSNFQDQSILTINNNNINQRILSSKQKVERHLLGSLRVPLQTLLCSGRIQGSFPLNQPMFLDNYQFQPEPTIIEPLLQLEQVISGGNNSLLIDNNNNSTKDPSQTYINLFITIDPPISMSMINQQLYFKTGSYEQDAVFEYARLWELVLSQYNFYRHRHQLISSNSSSSSSSLVVKRRRQLNKNSSGGSSLVLNSSSRTGLRSKNFIINRHIRALVMQRDTKYCLIIRLITPMKPPEDIISEITKQDDVELVLYNQMIALNRFVSLLSPLKYGIFNVRPLASNLWFNSIQLINQLLGGYEEKAILLCNYFLHLGKCSAILLGDSLPEGRCVYVIVWHEQSRSFVEDQLALQARDLTNELRRTNNAESILVYDKKPVDQMDFITRLPILINMKSIQLWDPCNGKSYLLNDTQQALYSVGTIITCENVYANIQLTDNISDTNFDIRMKQFWYPLFDAFSSSNNNMTKANTTATLLNKKNELNSNNQPRISWRRQLNKLELMRKQIGRPLINSILTSNDLLQTINYEKFSPQQCIELKEAIEKNIKSSLLKWRPNRPTYFNRTLSRLLSDKLVSFETHILKRQNVDWKFELAESIRSEVLMVHGANSFAGTSSSYLTAGSSNNNYTQLPPSRQIVSWPVNLTYTSMKTILDSLFASGVHNADLELFDNNYIQDSYSKQLSGTQFLVACHVHPYPARVMSVWLYVAAILSNTNTNHNQPSNIRTTPIPQQQFLSP